jgi:Flp pilus assembly protein TadD
LAVCLAAGCAAHRPPAAASAATDAAARGAPVDSLSDYIRRVRQLSVTAVPARSTAGRLEQQDAALAEALRALAGAPSAARHRAAADAYLRRGVLDAAYDHFARAARLDRSDAASYEGMARIWREWGLPHLGLGDAHRAIYHAPKAASARNTLGTLLQSLGDHRAARAAYARALALDPEAAYALNNLCHLSVVERKKAEAARFCQQALALQPGLAEARGNLALALTLGPDR